MEIRQHSFPRVFASEFVRRFEACAQRERERIDLDEYRHRAGVTVARGIVGPAIIAFAATVRATARRVRAQSKRTSAQHLGGPHSAWRAFGH